MHTPKLAEALAAFQKEMPEIKLDSTVKVKTRSGASYDFKYATLQNIMKKVLPVLTKHGLTLMQVFSGEHLKTILLHTSGEKQVSIIPVDVHSGNMQEIGSRISYMKRYSIAAMLGIVAEEDDDANIADGNQYQKKETKTKSADNKPKPPPSPPPKKKNEPLKKEEKEKSKYQQYLDAMAEIKKEIEMLTGSTDAYYEALKVYEVEHANEIKNVTKGRELWKDLQKHLKLIRGEA